MAQSSAAGSVQFKDMTFFAKVEPFQANHSMQQGTVCTPPDTKGAFNRGTARLFKWKGGTMQQASESCPGESAKYLTATVFNQEQT